MAASIIDQIEQFAAQVQEAEKARHILLYSPAATEDWWAVNYTTHVKPGKKYTKVDVGRSGRFMVVNDTGEIFGIKAYGVIHRGHRYGTVMDPSPKAFQR